MDEAKRDTTITWDEETIERHDLDRGTRMKIEEPNTPYNYYDMEQDAEMKGDEPREPKSPAKVSQESLKGQMSELQSKLQEEHEKQQNEEGKAAEFSQKRKQHYNEYQQMLKWRQDHAGDDDEED